jgi:hypothetical protein
MLFIHTHKMVLEGRKTQTRRRARKDKDGNWVPPRYKEGRTYGVQTAWMGKSIARILITQIGMPELVRDITEEDARAEGFESREAFIELWAKAFGEASLDRRVWPIHFRLV